MLPDLRPGFVVAEAEGCVVAKRDNFYRRDPMAALNGMIGLTLEEKGVYNVVIDLLYSTWRPVEDNRQFIANWCGCAVQKVNPILERLIAKGKLRRVQEGGVWTLTNDHFDDERQAVKGLGSGRKQAPPDGSGQAEVEEKSGEVGEKSAGVREKSAGVGQNLPLLEHEPPENQSLEPLEKRREEKSRREAAKTPASLAERSRAERLNPDWRPSVENVVYAATQGFSQAETERIGEDFRDFWVAKAGPDARKLDWTATWRKWVRTEATRRGRAPVDRRPSPLGPEVW